MVERFALSGESHVVEVAANDGYLLQYVRARDISCTGIEPTASTAAAAREKGIAIVEDFFGVRLAQDLTAQGLQADLMIANNVLAHVPDINDFVAGFALLLKTDGVATFEFPHRAFRDAVPRAPGCCARQCDIQLYRCAAPGAGGTGNRAGRRGDPGRHQLDRECCAGELSGCDTGIRRHPAGHLVSGSAPGGRGDHGQDPGHHCRSSVRQPV